MTNNTRQTPTCLAFNKTIYKLTASALKRTCKLEELFRDTNPEGKNNNIDNGAKGTFCHSDT